MAGRPMLLVLVVQLLFICGQAMVMSDTDMEADKIGRLPGQPAVGFDHYSGYITIHHAHDHLAFQFDDDRDRGRGRSSGTSALFYYLAEAQTGALSKPLVLWLNGGPGCSSVGVGAFSENGPFRPGPHHELLLNPFAWNSEANMLYLETPVGVGFSYSTDPTSYQAVTDHSTAWDNLVFLQKWFLKFPQYKNRSLFITGESYAGHYIPQLAELMLQFNKKENLFNLKGIALGNPVLEFATDFNSRAEYFWSHGLISDATYKVFTTACNYSQYVGEYLRGNVSPMCSKVMSLVSRETSRFVDKYDVTLDVCLPSVFSQSNILNYRQPQQVGETIDVCVEDETLRYLNRRDVQKSLHARLVGTNSWTVCSKILEYELLDLETPTIHIVGNLVKEGIPVLIYSGDQDSVIPLTGSRTLVNQLAHQLGLNTTVPYRVWFAGKQVGGWTQVHGDILSFATIRGASHEAPFSQPERSLVLFKSFLEGLPLPELF